MKKILFLLLIFITQNLIAQPPGNKPGLMANVQGLKIAYFTRELSLNKEEAQRFWPVYYNYLDELTAARKERRDDVIATDEKILSIKKNYLVQFRTVLGNNNQRAGRVYICEREFGNYIKKEFENRQRIKGYRQQYKYR
jgi:hypothetical protein